MRVPLVVFEGV